MNLRNKLLISYLAASIAPIIAISATIFKLSADNIEDTSKQFASMYVAEVTASLNTFESEIDQMSRSIVAEASIMRFLRDDRTLTMAKQIEGSLMTKDFLVRLTYNYPEIKTAMLLSKSDKLYFWSMAPVAADLSIIERQSWYFDARTNRLDPLFISPVHELP
jgi:two-component system, sensor histidine kinase YesM